MLKPLQQWYCDMCGEIIEKPRDGYVIWRQDCDGLDYDFNIIHKIRCDVKQKYPTSLPLENFLGESGVQWLLGFLGVGKIKQNLGQTGRIRIKDIEEFMDFFRRMQTPYYEEARVKFINEELLDYYSDDNEVSPYLAENLKNIINTY